MCRAAAYDQQAIIDLIKSNSLIESSSTSAVARARSNNNNKKDEMNRLEALLKLVNEQPQKKTSHFSPADDPELDMSTVRLHLMLSSNIDLMNWTKRERDDCLLSLHFNW